MSEQKPPSNEPFDLSSLYQKGADEMPPESLDQIILAQAEEQIQPARRSRWASWQWPLSAAAVVVVASSIILDLHQQDQLGVEPMIMEEMMPMDSEMMETAPSLRMSAPVQQDSQTGSLNKALPDKVLPDKALQDEIHSENIVAPFRVMKSEQMMPAQAPAPAPVLNEPNVGTAEQFELQLKESRVNERKAREQSIADEETARRQSMKAMEFKHHELMRKKSLERQGSDQSVSGEEDVREPNVWLNDIQTLLDENKSEHALEELRAFRLAYPEYQLPEELQGLLGKE